MLEAKRDHPRPCPLLSPLRLQARPMRPGAWRVGPMQRRCQRPQVSTADFPRWDPRASRHRSPSLRQSMQISCAPAWLTATRADRGLLPGRNPRTPMRRIKEGPNDNMRPGILLRRSETLSVSPLRLTSSQDPPRSMRRCSRGANMRRLLSLEMPHHHRLPVFFRWRDSAPQFRWNSAPQFRWNSATQFRWNSDLQFRWNSDLRFRWNRRPATPCRGTSQPSRSVAREQARQPRKSGTVDSPLRRGRPTRFARSTWSMHHRGLERPRTGSWLTRPRARSVEQQRPKRRPLSTGRRPHGWRAHRNPSFGSRPSRRLARQPPGRDPCRHLSHRNRPGRSNLHLAETFRIQLWRRTLLVSIGEVTLLAVGEPAMRCRGSTIRTPPPRACSRASS